MEESSHTNIIHEYVSSVSSSRSGHKFFFFSGVLLKLGVQDVVIFVLSPECQIVSVLRVQASIPQTPNRGFWESLCIKRVSARSCPKNTRLL